MDDAEKWLAENDPDFTNYHKRRDSEYPFHTAWQEFYRKEKEIPISNLWDIRHKLKMDDREAREVIELMK